MANTDQITKAATDLGKLIAEHDAAKKFKTHVKRLRDDTEAQRILNDYNRHLEMIHEKETNGKPIEVADKQKLESLQAALVQNPLLCDFQLVQMDYMDLMRKVDEALQGPSPQPPNAASSASLQSPSANQEPA